MTERSPRRRWVVVVVTVIAMATGLVTIAWVRRTAPPWPAVAGTPYEIPLGSDGCPVIEERRFVDTYGPLVPPGATEVLLCITLTAPPTLAPQVADPPRQRVLRAGAAAEFAALLNRLPNRNQAWRQWQRRHSGWWPDAAPEPMGEACALIGHHYEYSFVLRYPDRPPVSLIYTCGGQAGGLTSGTRTRMDYTKPHMMDAFLSRLQQS